MLFLCDIEIITGYMINSASSLFVIPLSYSLSVILLSFSLYLRYPSSIGLYPFLSFFQSLYLFSTHYSSSCLLLLSTSFSLSLHAPFATYPLPSQAISLLFSTCPEPSELLGPSPQNSTLSCFSSKLAQEMQCNLVELLCTFKCCQACHTQ